MKTKLSTILLAGGFGTSFQSIYPSIPKPLIPLGHNPCVCILLETLLQISEIDNIFVLIFKRHLSNFEKEINRWFFNKKNIFLIPLDDTPGTAKSIEKMIHHKQLHENVLILYSNMPLLTKSTILDYINHYYENESSMMILVSRLKNYQNYDHVIIHDDHHVVDIIDKVMQSNTAIPHYCYLNSMIMKLSILLENIKNIDCNSITKEYDIKDIIKIYQSKGISYHLLNSYIANKECIIINKIEDKNYAEEIYMEQRNSIFIYQCYGLWKKCEIFENRLSNLESKLSS